MKINVKHFWVRFYEAAEWQVAKFYTEDGEDYIRGMDWGSSHRVSQFSNTEYEIGPEIVKPND